MPGAGARSRRANGSLRRSGTADLAVVGGGIVGLATARELLRRAPRLKLVVLEKESRVATHQTARNSGVIHSGIYYRPGSLKATTCVAGAALMIEFCRSHAIPVDVCGKVIVASDQSEVPRLEALHRRGMANGVPGLRLLDPERLRELEPHASGVAALHVPGAACVDFSAVARAFADAIGRAGGAIRTAARVTTLTRRGGTWIVETTGGEVRAAALVTCGGLYADRVAALAGVSREVLLVPFRGEYYELAPSRRFLVRGMVYPVPDPALPFLGVHVTRTISGRVEAGPNAILALAREGYRRTDLNPADLLELVGRRAFWRMAARYWRVGLREWARASSRGAFIRQVRRLIPAIAPGDLAPGKTGVRAQAIDPHGTLMDDFDIVPGDAAIHVRNVPSPAATASLRIAQLIADRAQEAFGI